MDQSSIRKDSSFLEPRFALSSRDVSASVPKKEKAKLVYASLFPKNLVLFITTHGRICVWGDVPDQPEDFVIPESIHSLFKLNLAPAGVSSSMSALSIKHVRDAFKAPDLEQSLKIKEEVTDLNYIYEIIKHKLAISPDLSETDDLDYLQRFIIELQRQVRPFYEEQMPKEDPDFVEERDTLPKAVNLHMWVERRIDPEQRDTMTRENQFVHFFPKGSRKIMVNKRFFTDNPFTEQSASPLNFGVIALNLNDGSYRNILPDILSSMKRKQRSTQHDLFLDTSDILEFVSNIKDSEGKPVVESVLILDTSCANFHNEIPEHKERLTSFSDHYGLGGKNKKTKKIIRKSKKKSLIKKKKIRRKKSKKIFKNKSKK